MVQIIRWKHNSGGTIWSGASSPRLTGNAESGIDAKIEETCMRYLKVNESRRILRFISPLLLIVVVVMLTATGPAHAQSSGTWTATGTLDLTATTNMPRATIRRRRCLPIAVLVSGGAARSTTQL